MPTVSSHPHTRRRRSQRAPRLHLPLTRPSANGTAARFGHTCLGLVRGLGALIASADRYTFAHCIRVAAYATNVARALALDAHELTTVCIGAYLHDLGKVLVPREILNKPGRLAQGEVEVIRTHPAWGVELLATIELPWDIKPIIRWHHECYDGTGYPDGLCAADLPIDPQIIGIADAYDALTTTRSYRPAVSPQRALAEMQGVRRRWHPDVYSAFMSVITCAYRPAHPCRAGHPPPGDCLPQLTLACV